MQGGSAAQALTWRQTGLGLSNADLPVPLRWRDSASLDQAIRRSLLEPEFSHANDVNTWPDGGRACLFLASTTLLGLQPSYSVAVVDQDGRLRFKEILKFRFLDQNGHGARTARPDGDCERGLERLGTLLVEQIVYVPDELAAEMDSLREPLSHALSVHSLSPLLARKARAVGETAVKTLSDWVSRSFDSVADPNARARFMLKARDWAAGADEGCSP